MPLLITIHESQTVRSLVCGSPGGIKICSSIHKSQIIQLLSRAYSREGGIRVRPEQKYLVKGAI